jgi:hypothetical protein
LRVHLTQATSPHSRSAFATSRAGTIAAVCCAIGICAAAAEEPFKKLSGAQIRAQFTGMQLTDGAHWGENYHPGGRLVAEEDSQQKASGTWQVKNDRLCTDFGKNMGSRCYEVWMSGRKVELRMPGSSEASVAGMLEPAAKQR